jgi:hypothetical protein
MTLNENHGIKAAPMKKLLDWLKSISAKVSFNYVFVVPSKIESKYRNQTLREKDNTVLKSLAKDLASIPQFVAPLDAFCDKNQLSLLPQFQRPQQEQPIPAIPSTDVQEFDSVMIYTPASCNGLGATNH